MAMSASPLTWVACANCSLAVPVFASYRSLDGMVLCHSCFITSAEAYVVGYDPGLSDSTTAVQTVVVPEPEMSPQEYAAYHGFSSVHEMRKAIGATE